MHELPVTESILRIVLRHAETAQAKKVLSVSLRVGELSDILEEWLQRYFDYLSRGTIAEGAALCVERVPVTFRCSRCGNIFPVRVREARDSACPGCGSAETALHTGRDFFIRHIEVL